MTSSQIGPVDDAVVPLPTAAQIRADVQEMVDFGPRLTGYPDEPAPSLVNPTRSPTARAHETWSGPLSILRLHP